MDFANGSSDDSCMHFGSSAVPLVGADLVPSPVVLSCVSGLEWASVAIVASDLSLVVESDHVWCPIVEAGV